MTKEEINLLDYIVVCISEFANKMLKNYKDVAWDMDIWSADEPTHLVHKNGDRFIGRPLW